MRCSGTTLENSCPRLNFTAGVKGGRRFSCGQRLADGEGEHQAGEAGEEQADADQGAEDPERAGGPGPPDEDGEDDADDGVEEQPPGAVAGLNADVVDLSLIHI